MAEDSKVVLARVRHSEPTATALEICILQDQLSAAQAALEQAEQRESEIRPLSDAERAMLYAQNDVVEEARRLSNSPGVINTTRDLDRALEKYDEARRAALSESPPVEAEEEG